MGLNTNQEPTQESPKVNYELLVEQLGLLAIEHKACESFKESIAKITGNEGVRLLFVSYWEDILDHFGIDYEEDEDERDELKEKVDELEGELDELRNKYGEEENIATEFKTDCFLKHKDEYSILDFEFLMQNGKELIKKHENQPNTQLQ